MSGLRDKKGRFIKGHKQLLSKQQLFENSIHVSTYWKGKKRPDMLGNKFGVAFAEKAHHWKGNKVKYRGLHVYIAKKFGTPQKCELCGTEKNRKYHWAMKEKKYSRNREDWMRVCVPCHKKYDNERRK